MTGLSVGPEVFSVVSLGAVALFRVLGSVGAAVLLTVGAVGTLRGRRSGLRLVVALARQAALLHRVALLWAAVSAASGMAGVVAWSWSTPGSSLVQGMAALWR